MTSRTRAAFAVAGIAGFAAPAAAEAATIAAPPCARSVLAEKTVPVQGTGFTPNSFVRITTPDGATTLGGAVADASGNFSDVFFGSSLLPSVRSTRRSGVQLVGTDSAGVQSPPITLDVVKITADLPDRARPGSRVRYRVLGFEEGKRVYLHIRRSGRTLGSFRIATAKGACGIAERRMRYMPLRRWRTGVYDYYFQHTPRFDANAPRVKLSISIFRRIRFR